MAREATSYMILIISSTAHLPSRKKKLLRLNDPASPWFTTFMVFSKPSMEILDVTSKMLFVAREVASVAEAGKRYCCLTHHRHLEPDNVLAKPLYGVPFGLARLAFCYAQVVGYLDLTSGMRMGRAVPSQFSMDSRRRRASWPMFGHIARVRQAPAGH